MNASQLMPASQIAQIYGVKILAFGGPGTGKTPICLTAPNPVLCACEPGLLSIRHSNIPVWAATDWNKIKEFVTWTTQSAEPRRYFQTICLDSASQAAELALKEAQATNRDGRRAYMQMSQNMMWLFDSFYYMQGMHVYLICKEATYDDGITKFRPYFPGQDLYIKTPHLYDEIFRIENAVVGGATRKMFRTKEGFNCNTRDRIGKLAEYEPTDLTHVIGKCLT